jgi:hypothetical protein
LGIERYGFVLLECRARTGFFVSIGNRYERRGLTKVRSEVFPEPLGPTSRIEGSVVKPLARKTNECRKTGIKSAMITVTAKTNGDGLKRASSQLEDIPSQLWGCLAISDTNAVRCEASVSKMANGYLVPCKRWETGVTAQAWLSLVMAP